MKSVAAKAWCVGQFLKMLEKGTMTYSNIYQRAYSWDRERECNLFASLVEGYPIPSVTCTRHTISKSGAEIKQPIYDLLNGKQRLTALRKGFNDEFPMSNLRRLKLDAEDSLPEFTDEEKKLLKYSVKEEDDDEAAAGTETIDINDFCFGELPESLRNLISNRMLRVEYHDNLTIDEERRIIINANGGKGMTPTERTRIEMLSFEQVLRLAAHPLFREALTEKAIAAYWNEKLVEQTYAILYMEEPTFESKVFSPFTISAKYTKAQEELLVSIFDRILTIYEAIKEINAKGAKQRILGKTHMTSMAPVIKRSIEDNISIEKMTEWLMYFFSGKRRASISDSYNTYSATASAARLSVRNRLDALSKSYEEYVIGGKEIPETEFWTVKVTPTPKPTPEQKSKKKAEIVRTVITGDEDDETNDEMEGLVTNDLIRTVVE